MNTGHGTQSINRKIVKESLIGTLGVLAVSIGLYIKVIYPLNENQMLLSALISCGGVTMVLSSYRIWTLGLKKKLLNTRAR